MNKSDKIREYFRKHPEAEATKVAAKFQASKPMTYNGAGWNPRVPVFCNGEFPTEGQGIYEAGRQNRCEDVDIDRVHSLFKGLIL